MDQHTKTIFRAERFVGRTSDRARVFVTAELRENRGEGKTTTTHEPAPDTFLSLSLVGYVYYPGDRRGDPGRCGQVVDELLNVLEPSGKDGWDAASVRELHNIWQRWHLNDLKAGCDHVPANFEPRNTKPGTWPVCPETGYRWGAAWLVKPLPKNVADRIRELFSDKG